MAEKAKDVLFNPLFNDNPIALQILGICSALAVTTKMETSITMSLAVIFVLSMSNTAVSLIRNIIPNNIRIIVQMTIIASLVIIVDQFLRAFAFDTSKQLSSLCKPHYHQLHCHGACGSICHEKRTCDEFLDGLGNAIGYSAILLVVGFFRELFGSGKLFGIEMFTLSTEGGWYEPNGMMLLPPSAFFLIGFFIWILRAIKTEQIEEEN